MIFTVMAVLATLISFLLGLASWETKKYLMKHRDDDMPNEEAVSLAFFSACFAFAALGLWMEVLK